MIIPNLIYIGVLGVIIIVIGIMTRGKG